MMQEAGGCQPDVAACAFESLFLRNHKRVYNLAFRLTGSRVEAEDVTQDAFVRAWHSFHLYDSTRPFEAWLYRIAVNLVIDQSRRRKRTLTYSLDAPLPEDPEGQSLLFELSDTSTDPETLLLSNEIGETLREALAALPVRYRVAVLLADMEERSYREIADLMQCPLGTVRSRIHRGHRMLRHLLKDDRVKTGLLR